MTFLASLVLALLLALPAQGRTGAGHEGAQQETAPDTATLARDALDAARQAVRTDFERRAAAGDGAAAMWLAEHTTGAESGGWYRKAAERGVPEACGELAWRYEQGQEVPQDHSEALRWLRRGADLADDNSLKGLAARYLDGKGVPADLGKASALLERLPGDDESLAVPAFLEVASGSAGAFAALRAKLEYAAVLGDARANWALYAFTLEGFGISDGGLRPALPYLRRAADLRDPEAQNALADLYAQGSPGVLERDPAAALALYREAALAGSSLATAALVNAYESGTLGPRGPGKAMEWLRRAALAEDPEAQVALAERLATGTHPGGDERVYTPDPDEALVLLRKAARRDNAQAMYLLGLYDLDGTPFARNTQGAAQWLRKAADLGHEGAMAVLADLYENGRGVPVDQAKAFALYEDAGLLIRLGRAYRDGRGTAQDPVMALDCFLEEVGRNPGPSEGLVWIGRMFELGRGVPANPAFALALYELSASTAGAVLRAQFEDRRPGATPQSRLAAYQAIAGELAGEKGALPADPARALIWFRKAASEYLERFEDGTL